MTNIQNVIMDLERAGALTDVLLPFLLIFTIVFAVLEKAKIFGEGKKNINVMISLILGLLVVIPHVTGTYPPNANIVLIMQQALPNISIVIVGVIMAMILIGVFGKELTFAGAPVMGIIALLSFATIAYIFAVAAGWGGFSSLYWLNDPQTQATLIVILVFGLLMWLITSGPKKSESKKFGEGLRDFFGFSNK